MRVAVEVACVWFELKENTTELIYEKCVTKCNINPNWNEAIARKTEYQNYTNNTLEAHFFMVNSNDGIKTEASIDYDMGTCLWSVADQFNITKLILFRVSHRICGVIANNLSSQYMKYLLVWN